MIELLASFLAATTLALSHGGIAVVASIIRYLWEYAKGEKFSIVRFISHGLAGLLIGNIAYDSMPQIGLKESTMWLVGFLAHPLLNLIDKKGVSWIDKAGILKPKDK